VWYGPRWLLLAGDAYFHHEEMDAQHPWCPPGLRLYQTLMEKSRTARLLNQSRLRALRSEHGRDVVICCSHAMPEFEALSNAHEHPGLPPLAAASTAHAASRRALP